MQCAAFVHKMSGPSRSAFNVGAHRYLKQGRGWADRSAAASVMGGHKVSVGGNGAVGGTESNMLFLHPKFQVDTQIEFCKRL